MVRMERLYVRMMALVLASLVALSLKAFTGPKRMLPAPHGYYRVTRVVDGDTLELNRRIRVRLIGVDTPESRYNKKLARDAARSSRESGVIIALGKKAADFTRGLCFGKVVRLEYDVERTDRYGRTLAYVYLKDGTFVNARILEEGYGQVMTVPPNVKYAEQFLGFQRRAREKRAGLWSQGDI